MPSAISPSEAWARVVAFAKQAVADQRVVHTLQRGVANTITDVRPGSIGRRSDEGRTNRSRVGRSAVIRLWKELSRKKGPVGTPDGVLYFTAPLMVAAMPDLVQEVGRGQISLLDDPVVAARDAARVERASRGNGGCGGGEGPIHRAIKEFIFSQPDEALSSLPGAPFTPRQMEWVFATGDRVDVVLTDCSGKVVLVEVKPDELEDEREPYAQASKYRALWNVLEERSAGEIRCVVAAPAIATHLAGRMFREHRLESVVVRAPRRE